MLESSEESISILRLLENGVFLRGRIIIMKRFMEMIDITEFAVIGRSNIITAL